MNTWNIIVVVMCLLLACFAIWLELKRVNKARLLWRLLATLVTIVAVACIILPLTYKSSGKSGNKAGILLTDGFVKDSINNYPGDQLFTFDEEIKAANPHFKITLLNSVTDTAFAGSEVSHLVILGYGLSADELSRLSNFPVRFSPAPALPGITALNWNHRLKPAEPLIVQGQIKNSTSKPFTLILKGLNTGFDSVEVKANTTLSFGLKNTPRVQGKVVYSLIALSGKDTIEKERIPFEVEAAKPVRVLMLATSPDFENKFLKDWLAKQGFAVAARTQFSKEKFSREFYSMQQTAIDRINPALLDKFDLLIGDLSAFKALSAAETAAIKEQMAAKGLGAIVKADSAGKGTSFLEAAFPLDKLSDKNQKTMALNIKGKTAPSAKLLLDAIFIKSQPNTQPLVTDEQNHILTSSTLYGSGKIVFTVLGNTFNWTLAGNHEDYTALWSMLIDKAARKVPVNEQWSTYPVLPIVNQPVKLILKGATALPPDVKANQSLLAFAQDETLPYQWSANYWPQSAGWQQVQAAGHAAYNYYVYNAVDWKPLTVTEKISATQRYAALKPVAANTTIAHNSTVKLPVSKVYFYLLLLLCCTFLWVEQRL